LSVALTGVVDGSDQVWTRASVNVDDNAGPALLLTNTGTDPVIFHMVEVKRIPRPPSPPTVPPALVAEPPHAPLAAGQTLQVVHEVRVQIKAAGDVSDFDDDAIADIGANLASAAGVTPSQVTVEISDGSVIINAVIAADDASTASTITSSVSAALSSPEAAGELLSITVLETPSVVAVERTVVVDANQSSENIVIILVPISVGVVVLAAAILVIRRKRHRLGKKVGFAA